MRGLQLASLVSPLSRSLFPGPTCALQCPEVGTPEGAWGLSLVVASGVLFTTCAPPWLSFTEMNPHAGYAAFLNNEEKKSAAQACGSLVGSQWQGQAWTLTDSEGQGTSRKGGHGRPGQEARGRPHPEPQAPTCLGRRS